MNGLLGKDLGRLLVDEVVAAFDGVERVPFGAVRFYISECGSNAPLRGSGVASHRVELGYNGSLRSLARFERRVQTCSASSNYDCFKFMNQSFAPSSSVVVGLRARVCYAIS